APAEGPPGRCSVRGEGDLRYSLAASPPASDEPASPPEELPPASEPPSVVALASEPLSLPPLEEVVPASGALQILMVTPAGAMVESRESRPVGAPQVLPAGHSVSVAQSGMATGAHGAAWQTVPAVVPMSVPQHTSPVVPPSLHDPALVQVRFVMTRPP